MGGSYSPPAVSWKRGWPVYKQYWGIQCHCTRKQPRDGAITGVHSRWLSTNCCLKTQLALTGFHVGSTNIQPASQYHLLWTVNRVHAGPWEQGARRHFPTCPDTKTGKFEIFTFSLPLFLGRVSLCSPSWPGLHCVTYVGLHLLKFLPQMPECWDFRHWPPHPASELGSWRAPGICVFANILADFYDCWGLGNTVLIGDGEEERRKGEITQHKQH